MKEYTYTVLLNGEVIASNMPEINAHMLGKVLLDACWGEPKLRVTLFRDEVTTVVEEDTNG